MESTPATALVRIDELSRLKAQPILDEGAMGTVFPGIDNPAEAEMAAGMLY